MLIDCMLLVVSIELVRGQVERIDKADRKETDKLVPLKMRAVTIFTDARHLNIASSCRLESTPIPTTGSQLLQVVYLLVGPFPKTGSSLELNCRGGQFSCKAACRL